MQVYSRNIYSYRGFACAAKKQHKLKRLKENVWIKHFLARLAKKYKPLKKTQNKSNEFFLLLDSVGQFSGMTSYIDGDWHSSAVNVLNNHAINSLHDFMHFPHLSL